MRALFYLLIVVTTTFAQDFSLTKFGSPLNTQNNEYSPVIAPNGRYIVFQSNRPGGEGGMDLWISENKNYQNRTEKPIWSEPVNFRELNTRGFEGPFSILFDAQGKPIEIYFTSTKDTQTGRNGLAGLNIYYVKNLTNKNPAKDLWSKPEHLMRINTNFDEKMPAISPDGKTLVFSSNRPGGFGGWDLWVSTRDMLDGSWSEPVNLGAKINTSANEIMPAFHYDGTSLFFSSDREDKNYKYSIYMADFDNPSLQLSEEEIEEPFPNNTKRSPVLPKVLRVKKLPFPINSNADDEGISLTLDGLWVYFASNREGGEGQFDIYRAPITDALRKPYAFDLFGIVVDGSEPTMIGLDATIKIYNSDGLVKIVTSKRIGGDITSKEKNLQEPVNFKTRILTGDTYKVEVSSPGFHPNQFVLDLQGSVGLKKSKYLKIVLMPIEEEQTTKEDTPPQKAEPELPTKKEEPPTKEEVKQESSILVYLKDAKTKEVISNGKITLFVEKERSGKSLEKEKDAFKLFPIPEEDFELTGKAKGYKQETLFVTKEDKEKRNAKQLEIYLQKKGDYAKIYDIPIYFEFNEYKILDSQKKYLDELAVHLKKNKDKIEIGGHTDNIASKEFNYKLSLKRAEAIIEYLVKKGISKERLIPKGYWYSQPAADNSTEEGRAKNRRVTFKKLE